ncbi:MAG: MBOAT family protein [Desulfarculus sp.]|nr:MBOAT family protein [Desulfarculus sp.]
MLFNSFEFIYAFLPLTLAGWVLLGRARGNSPALGFLVLASLVYYGWERPWHLPILLASCLFNHYAALRLASLGRQGHTVAAGRLAGLAVAANLGLLGYFKYTGFVLGNLNACLDLNLSLPNLAWPLGISFFTFQQIAYLVDVRRGQHPESHLLNYLLFVTFFPKVLAGPIVRASQFLPQLGLSGLARPSQRDLALGLALLVVGLFKKMALAEDLVPVVQRAFGPASQGDLPEFYNAWLGVLAYTLQIYFDFSGYSDMALGVARMLGLRLPYNFASPYKSVSIAEFWRRWHMTLSYFLRDYLYIPLGGNRRGQARRYLNLVVTMLLGGLWHGAGWTFVIWGGLHGLFLALHQAWRRWVDKRWPRRRQGSALGAWAGRLLTFFAVAMAWVFFRAPDLPSALAVFKGMLGLGQMAPGPEAVSAFLSLAWRLAVVWFLPNSQEYVLGAASQAQTQEAPGEPAPWWRWRPSPLHLGVVLALGFWALGKMVGQVGQFLYYQF